MEDTTTPNVRDQLLQRIASADLLRPYSPTCHEPGDVLRVRATGVFPAVEADLELEVLKQIGGGFAGQVYKTRLIAQHGGAIEGLREGELYAVKIIIPPSRFSQLFRDAIYAAAFQGAFSAQVNHDAVRAGALWQKLIRHGAAEALGSERAIVDVHATFFDDQLRSYGEVSEWVAGRTWRFEIDEAVVGRVFAKVDGEVPQGAQSAEYLHKKVFMQRVVRHFHDMGAPELARQYEWWTCKSQPNALKRLDAGDGPGDGLCAIDFRAGLALLFFLPMSPGDIPLCIRGLLRGKLVQFDRGDMDRLDAYLMEHEDHFAPMRPAVAELEQRDAAYRASLPDITHHHVKLLTPALRKSVSEGFITGWTTKGLVDDEHAGRLRNSTLAFLCFLCVGLLPLISRPLRRIWGDSTYAQHVRQTLTSYDYFKRRLRARQYARLIDWNHDERVTPERALAWADRPLWVWLVGLCLGWLPAGLFHFVTSWAHFKDRLINALTYPVKLYLDAEFREDWLRDQVEEGRDTGMLAEAEADHILERISEPFIQKYLKSVAVHACTVPVTQVVAAIAAPLAAWYVSTTGGSNAEAAAAATATVVFLQTTPISPGSLTRGAYVFFMMIWDRNIKDYWIAAFVSFWHYIGYLAFPIQMVAKYPDLARFMAGTWATKMVRIVPVFGEAGALMEHWIYDAFFNLPLTIRHWVLGLLGKNKDQGAA